MCVRRDPTSGTVTAQHFPGKEAEPELECVGRGAHFGSRLHAERAA